MTAYAEVIGDPIRQSKSPLIHTFWIGKLGLDADYRAEYVTAERLEAYLAEAGPKAPYFSMVVVHKRGEAWR